MSEEPSEKAIQEVMGLIERLLNPSLADLEDAENILDCLTQLVPHPAPSDLLYWPEREVTPREMAIEMLSYRPTPLGYIP